MFQSRFEAARESSRSGFSVLLAVPVDHAILGGLVDAAWFAAHKGRVLSPVPAPTIEYVPLSRAATGLFRGSSVGRAPDCCSAPRRFESYPR